MNAAKRGLWIAVGTLALFVATGASAETFVDLYAGNASTEDADFQIDASGVPGLPFNGKVSVDDAVVGGLRVGHWFDGAPFLGIAGDVSGFAPEFEDSSVFDAQAVVIPISLMLMLRAPLGATDDMPGGRVQPYAGIGPSAFVSAVKIDIPGSQDFGAATASLGLDVRGGLRILVTDWLAVFAEYRYTRFEGEVDDSIAGINVDLDAKFRTHHVNAGIGFHF